MKLKLFASTVAASILTLSGFSSPALADNRLTVSASSSIVLQGTQATFTPSATAVSENSSYDWTKFKWEISLVSGKVPGATAAVWQLSTSPCSGAVSGVSGGSRTCTSAITGSRTVLSAGATYANVGSATAKIIATSGSGVYRLRVWLDRDGNDFIDPYEPASRSSSLQIVDPSQAKAFVNLQIDPPIVGKNTLRATVNPGSVVGANGNLTGILDPSKLSIELTQCSPRSCSAVEGVTSWVPHPQLLNYEFSTSLELLPNSGYSAKLIYTKAPGERFILANRSFDYRSETPASLQTSVSAPSGLTAKTVLSDPFSAPRQKTNLADGPLSAFVYTATLKDKLGKPVVGKQVFVAFDLKDVLNPDGVLVDGQQIAPTSQDRVYLSRNSDSNGEVKLNVTYVNHGWLDRIGINALINGFQSFEFQGGAGEEVVVWDNAPSRIISMQFSKATSTNESNRFLTLRVAVSDREGRVTNGEKVIFGAESPLIIDEPIQILTNGGASTNVRLNNILEESGSAKVTAQIVGESGLEEAEAIVSWTNYGASIVGSFIPTTTASIIKGNLLGATISKK